MIKVIKEKRDDRFIERDFLDRAFEELLAKGEKIKEIKTVSIDGGGGDDTYTYSSIEEFQKEERLEDGSAIKEIKIITN